MGRSGSLVMEAVARLRMREARGACLLTTKFVASRLPSGFHRKEAIAMPETTSQKPRGYRVVITNGTEEQTIEGPAARVRHCQQRVMGWAGALPRDNRRLRRGARKVAIGPRLVMLTLTYADAETWKPNDIRNFMLSLRKVLGEALLAYAWVLEMQKRGAPHYHVLLYVKRGTNIPKPDEELWKHGLSRIETAKSAFYIAKYTGKEYQKHDLPPNARMFAVWIKSGALEALEMLPFD